MTREVTLPDKGLRPAATLAQVGLGPLDPRSRIGHAVLLSLLLAWGTPDAAFAAPPSTANEFEATAQGDTRTTIADVHVITGPVQFDQLKAVIGPERLGQVTLRWYRQEYLSAATLLKATVNPDVRVRCLLDLSQPNRATLYFADRSSQRFLYREMPLTYDLDALERQALAQIMELSVGAILDESALTLSRAEAEALLHDKSPTTEGEPAPKSTNVTLVVPRFSIGWLHSIDGFVPNHAWVHTTGLRLGTSLYMPNSRTALSFHGLYRLPSTYRTAQVGAEVDGYRFGAEWTQSIPLRMPASVPFGWAMGLGLGFGVEVIDVQPTAGTDSSLELALASPARLTIPLLSANLRVSYETASRCSIALATTVDWSTKAISFEVEDSGTRRTAFSARGFRPGLRLELSWN